MGKLKDLRREFKNIKSKGMRYGLTIKDYWKVKEIRNSIDTLLCATNQQWCDFYVEVDRFLSFLSTSSLFHIMSSNNIAYIQKHAFLLPLVLANNNGDAIKIHGYNYYFSCQFHPEKTPSLRVKNISNWGYCFGCGQTINSFTYLQEYENLKFQKVLQLLSQIYLFDIKQENSKLNPLAMKYQQTIVSEEYYSLLQEGLERYTISYHSEKEIEQVKRVYENQFETIERIRNHEYDSNFVYEEPKRKLYLEK